MTLVINFIGAPSSGKTTLCSLLFGHLKLKGVKVEYVPEFAKQLVWMQEFDLLNNQYYVTKKQYELLKCMVGQVDIVVTDSSLANGLYYNRYNVNNTSNVKKTEHHIIEWMSEFENMFIFVEKGNFPYEQVGRVENEEQAKHVEKELKNILDGYNIKYMTCVSSLDTLDTLMTMVSAYDTCK